MAAKPAKPKILVVDRGAFLPWAQGLVPGAEVLFFSEWRDVASFSRNAMIGRGIPGIERVDSIWKNIDDVDCVTFPDCSDGDMQMWLRERGIPVWGTGDAEMLELDRPAFKTLLEKLSMPVVPSRTVVGLDELEAILREEEDRYVKASFFRADLETYHHVNWHMTQPWFTDLVHRLGPYGAEIELIVEEPVAGVEIGYDGFVIDGRFPRRCSFGLERKDSSYIGMAVDADELPTCLREANEALSEPLGLLGARGNYSNEVRIAKDGTAYITDPCLRVGSPPGSAMSAWIENWPEIVMAGAHGELVDPVYKSQYAVEIELRSQWVTSDWGALDIPENLEPMVRLRRACKIDGQWWAIPHPWMDICGAAIGLGDTPEDAIDAAIEVAEGVQGYQLEWHKETKQALIEGWDEALDACTDKEEKAA